MAQEKWQKILKFSKNHQSFNKISLYLEDMLANVLLQPWDCFWCTVCCVSFSAANSFTCPKQENTSYTWHYWRRQFTFCQSLSSASMTHLPKQYKWKEQYFSFPVAICTVGNLSFNWCLSPSNALLLPCILFATKRGFCLILIGLCCNQGVFKEHLHHCYNQQEVLAWQTLSCTPRRTQGRIVVESGAKADWFSVKSTCSYTCWELKSTFSAELSCSKSSF